jgi:plastocyanin
MPIRRAAFVALAFAGILGACNARPVATPASSPTAFTTILGASVGVHASIAVTHRSAGIEARDDYFVPTILRGSPGAAVYLILRNGGFKAHNLTIPELHLSRDISPGDIRYATARFPSSGSIAFFCRFHRATASMIGELKADPAIPAPK